MLTYKWKRQKNAPKKKLELLRKSFECEREKTLEEFEEAKYNVEFANSKTSYFKKRLSAKRE